MINIQTLSKQPRLWFLILIVKVIPFHCGLWEEQQYWEPDGSGKRQGASHRPPWKGDPLRRISGGPADSVSWHRPSVTTL